MAGGIRQDAWTELELQELYERVNEAGWFDKVAPFVCRSEAAIRAKMCALRREAGIIPKPGPTSKPTNYTERQRATAGCEQLRVAILELA